MLTYKGHSLGDYVRTILFFGTVDSYSTQPGELEHKRVKAYYARTNKNDAVGQITHLERRETALLKISREQKEAEKNAANIPPVAAIPEKRKRTTAGGKPARKILPSLDFAESESLPYTPPEFHYHISQSRNFHFNLTFWLSENLGDPALKDFRSKLQEHLLGRLLHPTWSGNGHEFSPQQRNQLLIVNDRIYRHKVLRVNYTSYDVRRGQDSMNPRTQADIISLAPEDATDGHPFSYARILGVFHCDVVHNNNGTLTSPVPMSFLWVRRFRLDHSFKGGFKRKRLHRVEFLPDSDSNAFGFVDPDEVIRGAHLIPAFAYGPMEPVVEASLARKPDELDDWRYHYVNFFVDRDMFMRYLGGGVGHYQVEVPDDEADQPDLPDDDEDPAGGEQDDLPPPEEDSDEELPGEGDDDGSEDEDESEGEGEDEEEEEEEDLGPEDGEDGVQDLTVQLGYDAL